MARIRAIGAATVSLALVMGPGCSQIITHSTVEISPRTDATSLVLGPPGGEITARGLEAEWSQDGDRLALRLTESRTCASVRHIPVVRIERVERKTARGAMWFEYGLGAATLGVGLAGLIKPESFSQGSIDVDGEVVKDKSAGYRIGGIFTGLGVILLTAAVIDTVRTRDQVIYTDAYRREQGGTIECRDPLAPLQAHTIELLVDEWSSVEPTDDDGTVRFLLPPVEKLPEHAREVIEATAKWDAAKAEADAAAAKAAEEARATAEAAAAKRKRKGRGKRKRKDRVTEAERPADQVVVEPGVDHGSRPEPLVVKGVLRIDNARALAVDFVVPYEADGAREHRGTGAVEPMPSVDPPPRPTARRAEPEADVDPVGPEPDGARPGADVDPAPDSKAGSEESGSVTAPAKSVDDAPATTSPVLEPEP